MPNRILKESICTSDSVDGLSWFEEVLFYRLIVNCDDYGRFDARPAVLKARLFPLKERLTSKEVSLALTKLATVGIVKLYECDGKPYLQLLTWEVHQTIRAKKSKYPEPDKSDCNCMHMHADECECSRNPIQSESESNPNPKKNVCYADYRAAFISACPSLPQPNEADRWTDARKKAIRDKKMSPAEMEDVFRRVEKSDFLSGRSGKWNGCSLDWILKPANWMKICEGNYDNRRQAGSASCENTYDLDEFEKWMQMEIRHE